MELTEPQEVVTRVVIYLLSYGLTRGGGNTLYAMELQEVVGMGMVMQCKLWTQREWRVKISNWIVTSGQPHRVTGWWGLMLVHTL